MANIYNEHHDGMTPYGAQVAREVDNLLRATIKSYATIENIFELESLFSSSIGSAFAEFRLTHGLARRKAERAARKALEGAVVPQEPW